MDLAYGTNIPIAPYDLQSLRDYKSTHYRLEGASLVELRPTTSRACSAPFRHIDFHKILPSDGK